MSFIQDSSAQTTATLPAIVIYYSTQAKPTIPLNTACGIYNPSNNIIKIFTNNTDALTINSNQEISGNGSGLSNLNYNNINNAPNLGNYLTLGTASNTYATTAQLATKQNLLSNSTLLLGTGGSITGLNYNNISNAPVLTGYITASQLSTKQDLL